MRWSQFSTLTKTLCGGAAVTTCGALFYRYQCRSSTATTEKVPSLSAGEFNALQDQTLLRAALQTHHLPWTYHRLKTKNPAAAVEALRHPRGADDFRVVFYRLLGCPYCAKVEALLHFHDVPFDSAYVDPINGRGLPDKRYELVPQLYFSPPSAKPAAESGNEGGAVVYLVDSTTIVTALSEPLGFKEDLKDERVSRTREWITSHFQSASFALTNGTLRYAYVSFPCVTPEYYHGLLYHVVGTMALYALANFKIKPRIIGNQHPFNVDYAQQQEEQSKSGGDMTATKPQQALSARTPDAWLRDELAVFMTRVPSSSAFHGGSTPDLADIEMYGVTRVVHEHPLLGSVTQEGAFGAWQTAMEDFMKKRNGPQ